MKSIDTSGNKTATTQYFPLRLPHDLRAKLDKAHELTGRARAQILIAGAQAAVNAILSENTEAQSVDAAWLSFENK